MVSTIAGNTGWVELFAHHPDYGSKLPNYVTAAGGRSFPSSAGFNTSEFFFTDDTGVYFLPTRDMQPVNSKPDTDLKSWVAAHKARIVKLADGRLNIPRAMPHMEGHNTWCANVTGSTLIFPVADLAQHVILLLLYLVQNGLAIYDEVTTARSPAWPVIVIVSTSMAPIRCALSKKAPSPMFRSRWEAPVTPVP